MGNKAEAKAHARAGVPVRAGLRRCRPVDDRPDARAEKIGFPVMIKAAAGGGGRGMRVAPTRRPSCGGAVAAARAEAQAAFGDGDVYLETL